MKKSFTKVAYYFTSIVERSKYLLRKSLRDFITLFNSFARLSGYGAIDDLALFFFVYLLVIMFFIKIIN